MRMLAMLGAWSVLASVGCAGRHGDPTSERIALMLRDEDPRLGAGDAVATIVLFVDYQCPHSAKSWESARAAVATYPSQVQLVVKQLPRPSSIYSRMASRAALAAEAQGRFWEMGDRLFGLSDLTRGAIVEAARGIGLDMERFRRDFDSAAIDRRIDDDAKLAARFGLAGTPWWIVNGHVHKGTLIGAELDRELAEEILYGSRIAAARTSKATVYERIIAQANDSVPVVMHAMRDAPLDPTRRYRVPVGDDDAQLGARDSLVTVTLFADLQCPNSARALDTLTRLQREYGPSVRLVWKHDPLGWNPLSMGAHQALFAANRQGKAWEMAARLYERKDLSREGLFADARALGLDIDRFTRDMDGKAAIDAVFADRRLAGQLGLPGTPVAFVNGQPIEGAQPARKFRHAIDDELERAQGLAQSDEGPVYDRVVKDAPEKATRDVHNVLAAQPDRAPRVDVAVEATDAVHGPVHAPVTVVWFGDLEDSGNAEVRRQLDELERRHPGKLRVVFKHAPATVHPNAEAAALAMSAARRQGRAWQLAGWALDHQRDLAPHRLIQAARELGLDVDRFLRDFTSAATAAEVGHAMDYAESLGISFSPVLFVNGRQLPGVVPLDVLAETVQAELTPHPAPQPLQAAAPAAPSPVSVSARDPQRGPAGARVTIVGFFDFTCPYSAKMSDRLRHLQEKYPGDVRVVFKFFPLDAGGVPAFAARAAAAAADFGRFWDMHDWLMSHQDGLTRQAIVHAVENMGIDRRRWAAATHDAATYERINGDLEEGEANSVDTTPVLFLNGHRIEGLVPDDELDRLVRGSIGLL